MCTNTNIDRVIYRGYEEGKAMRERERETLTLWFFVCQKERDGGKFPLKICGHIKTLVDS